VFAAILWRTRLLRSLAQNYPALSLARSRAPRQQLQHFWLGGARAREQSGSLAADAAPENGLSCERPDVHQIFYLTPSAASACMRAVNFGLSLTCSHADLPPLQIRRQTHGGRVTVGWAELMVFHLEMGSAATQFRHPY
jgi:hypothetical protein